MDDLSAIAVARAAPMLTNRFRIPHQPDDLPARVADKAELSRLCARWDLPHPETVISTSGAEAARAAWRLGLPVVAKWSRPWLLPTNGHGLRSTVLVHTPAETRRLYERRGAGCCSSGFCRPGPAPTGSSTAPSGGAAAHCSRGRAVRSCPGRCGRG